MGTAAARNLVFFGSHPRCRTRPWIDPLHKFFLNQPDFQDYQYMHLRPRKPFALNLKSLAFYVQEETSVHRPTFHLWAPVLQKCELSVVRSPLFKSLKSPASEAVPCYQNRVHQHREENQNGVGFSFLHLFRRCSPIKKTLDSESFHLCAR